MTGSELFEYFYTNKVKYAKADGTVKRELFLNKGTVLANDVISTVEKFLKDQKMLSTKDKKINTVVYSTETSLLIVEYEYSEIRKEFNNRAFNNVFEVHSLLRRANT